AITSNKKNISKYTLNVSQSLRSLPPFLGFLSSPACFSSGAAFTSPSDCLLKVSSALNSPGSDGFSRASSLAPSDLSFFSSIMLTLNNTNSPLKHKHYGKIITELWAGNKDCQ